MVLFYIIIIIFKNAFKSPRDADQATVNSDCKNPSFWVGGAPRQLHTLACGPDCCRDITSCMSIAGTLGTVTGKINIGDDARLPLSCISIGQSCQTISTLDENEGRTNAVLDGQQRLVVYMDVLGCAVS